MNISESILIAVESIFANKMRSLLTMLGIIIGISSVIIIVSLGRGSQEMIRSEFESFGVNRAYLGMNWEDNPPQREYITDDDLEVISDAFSEEIKGICPSVGDNGKIAIKTETIKVIITGANEQYDKIENIAMKMGRFISDGDMRTKRQVVVIDENLALKVFGRENVLDEEITLNLNNNKLICTIVGVMKNKKQAFAKLNGGSSVSNVYIPLSTMEEFTGMNNSGYWGVEINFEENVRAQEILDKMIGILERKHGNAGKNYYISYTAESELAMANKITGIMTLVVGAIAAISLLVGGIGVMNIMLVSVTERTREIGIRKAIGARHRDIMIQFLVESVIVSVIGGFIGIISGIAISAAISLAIGFPPVLSVSSIAVATLFSAGVGIFFGYYPARKASKMDPINSLRYE